MLLTLNMIKIVSIFNSYLYIKLYFFLCFFSHFFHCFVQVIFSKILFSFNDFIQCNLLFISKYQVRKVRRLLIITMFIFNYSKKYKLILRVKFSKK